MFRMQLKIRKLFEDYFLDNSSYEDLLYQMYPSLAI